MSRYPLPSKEDNLHYNLADLAAFDLTSINTNSSDHSQNLTHLTRDNTQLLVNKLFTTLPLEQVVEKIKAGGSTGGSGGGTGVTTVGVLRCTGGSGGSHSSGTNTPNLLTKSNLPIELKKPFIRLPRQKPVPRVKEPTRWEKFAAEKGIQKKKRSKLVYDEETGEWGRRYGYGSIKQRKEKRDNWLIEVKKGDDGKEDPFTKKKAEKNLEVAKQRMRQLRNKVEGAGYKMMPAQLEKTQGKNSGRGKDGLSEALKRAQTSSASIGKFDRLTQNESKIRRTGSGKNKVSSKVMLSKKEEKAGITKMLDKMERRALEKPMNNKKGASLSLGGEKKSKKTVSGGGGGVRKIGGGGKRNKGIKGRGKGKK